MKKRNKNWANLTKDQYLMLTKNPRRVSYALANIFVVDTMCTWSTKFRKPTKKSICCSLTNEISKVNASDSNQWDEMRCDEMRWGNRYHKSFSRMACSTANESWVRRASPLIPGPHVACCIRRRPSHLRYQRGYPSSSCFLLRLHASMLM